MARRGEISRWTPLWIADAIVVTGDAAAIDGLARRPDVVSVVGDRTASIRPTAAPPAEPGVGLVGAPGLWAAGNTGQGVVVASLDQGVDAAHPALAGSWRGGTNSWYDPYGQHAVPFDATGHGTAAMGVMVGAGGIGVAPGATWISARVFDDQGSSSIAAMHQAFQWVLDPDGDPATLDAPDVVLNSWTFTTIGCDPTFQPDLQALVAAGILPVFAAGNMGPNASTNGSPANLPEAFSVGATDASDAIAPFSSRGPAVCKHAQVPEMVAPGVAVRSSWPGQAFATVSGTSFAAPHVAGAAALILAAAPRTTEQGLRDALTSTAVDLGTPGVDDAFGAGRLDIPAAVAAAVAAPPSPDVTAPATFHVHPSVPATSHGPVAVTAVVVDTASPVAAAEAFVDAVGTDGAGIPLAAVDGVFDTRSEQVTGTMPAASVAGLEPGYHQVLVHGRDAAGNWGAVASTVFVVDRTPPAIAGGPSAPIVLTAGDHAVWTVTATDPSNAGAPGSALASASLDETGAGTVAPVDGAFGGPIEGVGVRLNAGAPSPGRSVTLRVVDAAGNAAVRTYTLVVRRAGIVFADEFRGDLRRWDRVVGAPRARRGTLSAPLAVGRAFVEDATPDAESAYRIGFDVASTGRFAGTRTVLEGAAGPGTPGFAVQIQSRADGRLRLRLAAARTTPWIALPTGGGHVTVTREASGRLILRAGRAATTLQGASGPLATVRLGVVSAGPVAAGVRLRFAHYRWERIPRGDVVF